MSHEPRLWTVFGFGSVHDALAAEEALRRGGVDVVTIPSPRELGDLCGVALRLDPRLSDEALEVLRAADAEPKARAVIMDV